jgi:hypothetical protein
MSSESKIWTKNGKLYYIKQKYGRYYVSKPGHGGLGDASTLDNALSIIKSHSGSTIKSID